MDDIIIYSKNLNQHYKNLRIVLMELASCGLITTFRECSFVLKEFSFLGFTITGNQLRPEKTKLLIFNNDFKIEDVKKLHSILGLLIYYRGFIKNFFKKVYCLQKMINKKTSFSEYEAKKILILIWKNLVDDAFLELPNDHDVFVVETDAFNLGLGAVLKQVINDKELTIRFFSRYLNR